MSGVCDAGLSTTGHPAAIAGATLCDTRLRGKLNGLIAPTTPIGTRSVNASLPTPASFASIGIMSPVSVRASTAANRNVPTARAASTRAAFSGLAASAAIERANSSWRADEPVGGGVEDRGPLVRGHRLGAHGRGRGRDGGVDVGRAPGGHPAQLGAVERRSHGGLLGGGDALGADAHGMEFSHAPRLGPARVYSSTSSASTSDSATKPPSGSKR